MANWERTASSVSGDIANIKALKLGHDQILVAVANEEYQTLLEQKATIEKNMKPKFNEKEVRAALEKAGEAAEKARAKLDAGTDQRLFEILDGIIENSKGIN